MFSESSTGSCAELQLPCCPIKQGELPENMLQNLFLNLSPQTVYERSIRSLKKCHCKQSSPYCVTVTGVTVSGEACAGVLMPFSPCHKLATLSLSVHTVFLLY